MFMITQYKGLIFIYLSRFNHALKLYHEKTH